MKNLNITFQINFIVLGMFFYSGLAQEVKYEQGGIGYSKSFIDSEFSYDKVYDKHSGRKLEGNEVNSLIKKNPRFLLEKVYDEEGRVVKYLYDKTAQAFGPQNISISKSSFDKFTFATIDDRKISLHELTGKLVLI
ncbi:hypothetical protein MTsPCn5_10980 [Croceitalea sp. MTPC5]|uniref:hypothetical protein n=1 Tax=Croceitalea sp. MTPC5 TaxID=3056565 RepID=UPI002B3EDD0A|nr:hypothetical protein MTsPCn5_10980 [Croceitalea sp. MTPC5]